MKSDRPTPERARSTPWPFLYTVVQGQLVKNVPRRRIALPAGEGFVQSRTKDQAK